MSDRASIPGGSENDLSEKSDERDEAREAALMREIISQARAAQGRRG